MYKHSCIVYLQEMKLLGMLTWTLMSLIAHLESLLGQSSTVHAPQTILTPGMHKDPIFFKPLSQIQLNRSTYKVTSYVNFAPYV